MGRKTSGGEIGALQADIADWADSVFPNRTAHNSTCKLMLEEIPEWLQNQDDPGEYADLVILILDIGYLKGINVGQAVIDKMKVNRARKWKMDPERGFLNHICPLCEERICECAKLDMYADASKRETE